MRVLVLDSVASDLNSLIIQPHPNLVGSLKQMIADLRIPERYSRDEHADIRNATYETAADRISEILPPGA